MKLRRESIEAYERAGRPDLAAKEQAEVTIIGEFLPQPLSEAELRRLVEEAIVRDRGQSGRVTWARSWPCSRRARAGAPTAAS